MAEQYLNIAKTTVSNTGSGYSSGAGSLKVASTTNGTVTGFTGAFPTTGTFTVAIVDAATQQTIKAQLTVTAVTNSTTWAVSSEIAGSAVDGDIVVACWWSARAISQIRADVTQYGVLASRPSSGMKQGDSYVCSDYPLQFVYDGSNWQHSNPVNLIDRIPVSANAMDDEFTGSSLDVKWTERNTPIGHNRAITVADGSCTFSIDGGGNNQTRLWMIDQPVPAGNWKMRCKAAYNAATFNYTGLGMGIRKSSGDKNSWAGSLFHASYGVMTMYQGHFSPIGTLSTESDLYDIRTMEFYLEVEYDGTNLIWRYSTTGVMFRTFWSETLAGYLVSMDTVGIGMHVYTDGSTNNNPATSFDWFRRIS